MSQGGVDKQQENDQANSEASQSLSVNQNIGDDGNFIAPDLSNNEEKPKRDENGDIVLKNHSQIEEEAVVGGNEIILGKDSSNINKGEKVAEKESTRWFTRGRRYIAKLKISENELKGKKLENIKACFMDENGIVHIALEHQAESGSKLMKTYEGIFQDWGRWDNPPRLLAHCKLRSLSFIKVEGEDKDKGKKKSKGEGKSVQDKDQIDIEKDMDMVNSKTEQHNDQLENGQQGEKRINSGMESKKEKKDKKKALEPKVKGNNKPNKQDEPTSLNNNKKEAVIPSPLDRREQEQIQVIKENKEDIFLSDSYRPPLEDASQEMVFSKSRDDDSQLHTDMYQPRFTDDNGPFIGVDKAVDHVMEVFQRNTSSKDARMESLCILMGQGMTLKEIFKLAMKNANGRLMMFINDQIDSLNRMNLMTQLVEQPGPSMDVKDYPKRYLALSGGTNIHELLAEENEVKPSEVTKKKVKGKKNHPPPERPQLKVAKKLKKEGSPTESHDEYEEEEPGEEQEQQQDRRMTRSKHTSIPLSKDS